MKDNYTPQAGTIEAAFGDAIRTAGLTPPNQIITDGEIHHFPTNEKTSDRAGWYVSYPTGGGAFGCHRRGIKERFKRRGKPNRRLTAAEWRTEQERYKTERTKRALDLREREVVAEREARRLWRSVSPADKNHRYLVSKQVRAHGIGQLDDDLIVPLKINGRIRSIQRIPSDSGKKKKFLEGAPTKGGYFVIGNPKKSDVLLVAEGYSTSASLFEATGFTTVVAFNAGNLMPVAKLLREKYSNSKIIIAGDDDQWKKDANGKSTNPGKTKAIEAAKAIGVRVVFPRFDDLSTNPTDFNDLHCLKELPEVRRQVEEGLEQAPEEIEVDLDARIGELALLSSFQYEHQRKKAAADLDVRVSALDTEVKKLRSTDDNEVGSGRPITLYEFEDWPEEVDGAETLDDAAQAILERFDLPKAYADACVLWATHTHMFEAFQFTPRLMITSPEPACGKTRLLWDIIGDMVPKPKKFDSMTPAAFFRLAEEYRPCFLIDEVDRYLEQDNELISSLNTGVSAGGSVPRCVGDDHKVREFYTHAPVGLAGINLLNKLPPPTISRCIVLTIDRGSPEELKRINAVTKRIQKQKREIWATTGVSEAHDPELEVIGRKLASWTKQHREDIALSFPDTGLIGREADMWQALFSTAEVAGGKWPERCRAAFQALTKEGEPKPSKGHELLSDIRDAFGGDDKIWTEDLIERLCKDEDKPWANYNFKNPNNANISRRQIYELLQPYGVKQKQVFIDGANRRGFRLRQFKIVFDSYLPPLPEKKANGRRHRIRRRKRVEVQCNGVSL